jgi:hypothetical protein
VRARGAGSRTARALAVSTLIFGVVHVPLPQADYHNIRHHDGPGEVCPYHDHLLRWHPSASVNDDVALLHWHWFVPPGELGEPSSPPGAVPLGAASGPAVHAHVANSLAPNWPGDLITRLDSRGASLDPLTLNLAGSGPATFLHVVASLTSVTPRITAAQGISRDGLRAERSALFARWNC